MRYLLLILLTLLSACADFDGRPVAAPSGISAVQVNGDPRGGGADPIFSPRGANGTYGLGNGRPIR